MLDKKFSQRKPITLKQLGTFKFFVFSRSSSQFSSNLHSIIVGKNFLSLKHCFQVCYVVSGKYIIKCNIRLYFRNTNELNVVKRKVYYRNGICIQQGMMNF